MWTASKAGVCVGQGPSQSTFVSEQMLVLLGNSGLARLGRRRGEQWADSRSVVAVTQEHRWLPGRGAGRERALKDIQVSFCSNSGRGLLQLGDPRKSRIRSEDHKFGCDEFGVPVRPPKRGVEWARGHRGLQTDV